MTEEQIKRPETLKDEHLDYLDNLRESGETNMFGAGVYLRERFCLTKQESHAVLHYWMKTFEERQIPIISDLENVVQSKEDK